jgi:hypothetical protein
MIYSTGVSIETALVKEVKWTQINRYIDAIHTISIRKKECITHKNNNLVERKGMPFLYQLYLNPYFIFTERKFAVYFPSQY